MTTLAEVAIRRPVFAWMLMFGLILFGAISFKRLGISQMPDVDFPVLSVNANWEGAAPEVIESEVVDPVEQQIISVEGIREMTSTIRQGSANINIEFDLKRDVDVALQEVQSALSRVRLPLDMDPPTIRKSNPEDQPILWIGLAGNRSIHELILYVDQSLKDKFQILPGVGEIILGGFSERNLRVWVDNKKLTQYELTILDVRDAIQRGHLETAAGRIENQKQELNLRVMGEGVSPVEVGNILITSRGGRPIYNSTIRVNDVATVEDGLADIRRVSRVNGEPAIGIGIRKQRGSNAVDVGDRVKKTMEDLRKTLPSDLSIGINFDSTIFIKESVEETEFTLLLSALATALVCWLFLGSIRPTFNVLLSIPTSIIGALTVIYFMGFTLNFFTILGLALAVGIVVDDAIMVLENIYRHKAMGKDKVTAARDGANEITFAAVAASIAVIAIFIPVAFMEGIIGKFFFQFGVTISAAVALSLLEAITLTPMRCSQFMEEPNQAGFFARMLESVFQALAALYGRILRISLNIWPLVIVGSLGIFAWSLTLLGSLRQEFIPAQDQGVFLMRAQAPVGSSLDYTSAMTRKAEEVLMARKDIKRVYTAIGGFGGGEVNTATIFVTLNERKDRSLSQQDIMKEAREALSKIPDLKIFLQDLSTRGFTARRGFPIEFSLRGPNWETLQKTSDEVVKKLEASGLVVDVDTDFRLGQPEVQVTPRRDEAVKRGIQVSEISDTVAAAIGGIRQGKFTQDGRRYDVRIRLKSEDRLNPDAIDSLMLRNQFGELVPLSDVIKIETVGTLQTLTRVNRERAISVFANVAPKQSQAAALAKSEEIARVELPPGYSFSFGGGAQTFTESFRSLMFVLWLGVLVAYMILASQFNSFIHPITVLVALPFSVTGAFMALWLSDQSLNLYSMIGLILLMGIVKKNSIMLVEFTNVKREKEQLPVREAILTAAPIRLRPILMTSFATLAAAVPPAMAVGPGAESRIPMSIAVIGGVLVSTIFTLIVVPCVYRGFAYLERKSEGHDD